LTGWAMMIIMEFITNFYYQLISYPVFS